MFAEETLELAEALFEAEEELSAAHGEDWVAEAVKMAFDVQKRADLCSFGLHPCVGRRWPDILGDTVLACRHRRTA